MHLIHTRTLFENTYNVVSVQNISTQKNSQQEHSDHSLKNQNEQYNYNDIYT